MVDRARPGIWAAFVAVSVGVRSLCWVGVDTITLFLAMLAIVAVLVAVASLASYVTGDRLGIWAAVRPLAHEFAAAVAVTATLGSLYLSEIADYTPCRLCWVQRAFMYPAALLLVAALVTRRNALARAAGIWAAIGLPVSIFHRYEQAYGGVGDFCAQDNPCSLVWVREFGVITIPTMAGIGFLTIAVVVGLRYLDDRRLAAETGVADEAPAETAATATDLDYSSDRS